MGGYAARIASRVALLLVLLAAPAAGEPRRPWWRGNLHTHTLWSDGDQYPEMVFDWYRRAGYHFVVLSDHNTLAREERWIDVSRSVGGLDAYRAYLDRFGPDWVVSRWRDGALEVLLTPVDECRLLLEEPGRFLVLPGEEITTAVPGGAGEAIPAHLNATNLALPIAPAGGASVREVLQRGIDAVLAQRRRTGQPMFPHVPHPNYGWAVGADDLAALRDLRFVEIFNGHPWVRNDGDVLHPPVERLWDLALTERLRRGDPPLFGLAVDDAHAYGGAADDAWAAGPGRGWVMVRAARLDAAALVAALEEGDFYASTGVTLRDLRVGGGRIALRIHAEPGVTYTTRFIGTRRAPADDAVGVLLDEVSGPSASYHLRGDELYVRAVVVSSKTRARPAGSAELERAWLQPLVPRAARRAVSSPPASR